MVCKKLSTHAYLRAADRASLSDKEIFEILECGRALAIGKEAGTKKVHLLFFSPFDRDFLVAVLDEKNGEVVTILRADYHNLWVIPYEAFTMARRLAEGKPAVADENWVDNLLDYVRQESGMVSATC